MILEHIVWNVSPELISSPVSIRWYGLMFAIGFLIGYEIESRIYKHEGAPERWLGVLLLWVMAVSAMCFSMNGTTIAPTPAK